MTAHFVKMPFTVEDLRRPYLAGDEVEYAVAKTILLGKIDYTNFLTDMCVERWFIEEHAELCRIDESGVWHCILVTQKGLEEGILVMSDGLAFPKYSALQRRL